MFHFPRRFSRALIALILAGVSASAARISIDDRSGGVPVVENDIPVSVELSADQAVLIFNLIVGENPIPVGIRSVILVDQPNEGGGPSDFATLTAEAPLAGIQLIVLFFQSDGAVGFESNVAALPSDTPRTPETGELQDVSSFLETDPPLTVLLASNVNPPPPIPEPITLMLMGIGFLAAPLYKRCQTRKE